MKYRNLLPIIAAVVFIPSVVMAQDISSTPECVGQIAFSKQIYEGAVDIYLLAVDGSSETPVTNSRNGIYITAEQPSWSPDGKRIVFSGLVNEPAGGSSYNTDIFAINIDGSHLERLTIETSDEIYPVFSPDGSRIAFASNRDGNWQVYVMNIDGNYPVNITNSEANDGEWGLDWSPDGTEIAFVTDRGKGSTGEGGYEEQQIYSVDALDALEDSNERRFTNLTANVDICGAGEFYRSPAWSHSGDRFAFALGCGDEYYDVYVIGAASNGDVLLTPSNLSNGRDVDTTTNGYWGLSWSPDDRQIVYSSRLTTAESDGSVLLVQNSNTQELENHPRQLTHYNSPDTFAGFPAWQPCLVGQ